MPKTGDGPDAPLQRLGGGRWQTRDGRFTIEPQSGTWVVVDSSQTDELGLPLVRGPFGSLSTAKEAIAEARTAAPPSSPLEGRVATSADAGDGRARSGRGDTDDDPPTTSEHSTRTKRATPATPAASRKRAASTDRTSDPEGKVSEQPAEPKEAEEPRWLRDLEPDDRRRARRAMERLRNAGAADPEGLVRRDLVGDVPAIATWAITRALRDAGADAAPRAIAELLADGHDSALGVRWHLVDGDGRRLTLDLEDPDDR